MEYAVQHQESDSKGAFFIAHPEGRHLAEMTYSRATPALIISNHTEVDPSLADQGIGRKLLGAQHPDQGHAALPVCQGVVRQGCGDS